MIEDGPGHRIDDRIEDRIEDQADRIDALLVKRVQADDDRQAFELLVRRHQGLVRAQLLRLLKGDAASADELAQEVFLRLWQRIGQFRGDSRFATWLYRLAHNAFVDQYRRRDASVRHDDDEALAEVRAVEAESGLGIDLQRAVQALPTMEREAFLYCVELGLSHDEAARVMGLPLGTLKSHVLRGKQRLRDWLQHWKEHA